VDARVPPRPHRGEGQAAAMSRGVPASIAKSVFGGTPRRWVRAPDHRREFVGGVSESICLAILRIVEAHPDRALDYPGRLSPRLREPVRRRLAPPPTGFP
jgi:UDP-N-acetylglucosamine 2-epimerase